MRRAIARRVTVRRALVALSLLGVVALAGCSSSGGSSSSAASSTPTLSSTAGAGAGDIVAVASATPELSTLVAAVKAADLVTTLQGAGPYTVFAPTNAAFTALPAGLVTKLLLPCNKDALVKVLTYHVLASKVTAAEITPGDVTTVEGSTVKLATDGGVKVNDATVTMADVAASNGVVHVIDKVLVPPNVDLTTLKTTC